MKQLECPLSSRHCEVLSLAAQGKSMREIGEALGTTAYTVKNQLQTIYERLQVPNGTAAVVTALREGWIDFPPKEEEMCEMPLQERSHVE